MAVFECITCVGSFPLLSAVGADLNEILNGDQLNRTISERRGTDA